ncbi:MAG TPA: acylphosphatase [Candidatus Binataceae bacterium]|nr:acylphosphatase [Candidatus Binataceae bacterium]
MPQQSRARIHLVIRGRVQGVGFRFATFDEARDLGLSGWVRNLPGGEVEVFAEGRSENLRILVAWAHQGPRLARVDAVVEEWLDFIGDLAPFQIR